MRSDVADRITYALKRIERAGRNRPISSLYARGFFTLVRSGTRAGASLLDFHTSVRFTLFARGIRISGRRLLVSAFASTPPTRRRIQPFPQTDDRCRIRIRIRTGCTKRKEIPNSHPYRARSRVLTKGKTQGETCSKVYLAMAVRFAQCLYEPEGSEGYYSAVCRLYGSGDRDQGECIVFQGFQGSTVRATDGWLGTCFYRRSARSKCRKGCTRRCGSSRSSLGDMISLITRKRSISVVRASCKDVNYRSGIRMRLRYVGSR